MKSILRIAGSSVLAATLLASAQSASAQAKPIWRTQSITLPAPEAAVSADMGSISAHASSTVPGAGITQAAAALNAPIGIVTLIATVPAASGAHADAMNAMTAGVSCPVATSFMKINGQNDSAQVKNLQAFLKAEGYDVKASGIFDTDTETAVKAFQKRYMSDIMAPWGATRASGMVYLTTAQKMNEIACGSRIALSPADMNAIRSYASATAAAEAQNGSAGGEESQVVTLSPQASSTSANAAAAGATSFYARFKGFLKTLFSK